MQALIAQARQKYHLELLANGVLTIDANGVPSNADRSSALSISIAQGIAERLMANEQKKAVGQTAGAKFEQINMEFIEATFPYLQNLRPGKWHIAKLGNRNSIKTSSFAQYEHLAIYPFFTPLSLQSGQCEATVRRTAEQKHLDLSATEKGIYHILLLSPENQCLPV